MTKYECSKCDQELGGKSSARLHFRIEHGNSDVDAVTLECPGCGIEFLAREAQADERRFCSSDCLGDWRSENWTGEDSPVWEGGEVDYGESWPEKRREARERDGDVCQVCAVREDDTLMRLEVHHIIPVRNFDSPEEAHRLDNLITMCSTCHGRWEGIPVVPARIGGGGAA